ncbi:MAG: methylenetetrahydrofolate reductase [Nitrospiraceae bacterium]|nr:methylenetetrahydrofolate reductase [Nitrospiraceae bacterium]
MNSTPQSLYSRLRQAMEERLARRDSGEDLGKTRRSFVVTFELVPARASKGKALDEILGFARETAAGGLLSALSITDNAGGHPALTPRALGAEIKALGIDPIIHFSCKDKNRSLIESQLFALDRSGLRNLLVLTGDYPRYGFMGNAKPVFDLDSVQVLGMVSEMNQGFGLDPRAPYGGVKLAPMHFYAGCVVSPFKRLESELVPQYLKLRRKIAAGAGFVISQLGFDVRKYDELRQFIDREGLGVPLLGTVFIPTIKLARILHRGLVPGCILPGRLLEQMERENRGNMAEEARLERGARLIAVLKGLGYEGVHLSGPDLNYSQVSFVIKEARKIGGHWKEFVDDFIYPEEWKFWYFRKNPDTELNQQEPSLCPTSAVSMRDSIALGLGRIVHRVAFTPGKALFGSLSEAARRIDGSPFEDCFTAFEYWIKRWLYGCQGCGDCRNGFSLSSVPVCQISLKWSLWRQQRWMV